MCSKGKTTENINVNTHTVTCGEGMVFGEHVKIVFMKSCGNYTKSMDGSNRIIVFAGMQAA